MATRGGRLFLLDGAGMRPFAIGADPLLRKLGVYTGALLRDGAVGIGTLSGGFLIPYPRPSEQYCSTSAMCLA